MELNSVMEFNSGQIINPSPTTEVKYNIINQPTTKLAGTSMNTLQLYECAKSLLLAKAWAGSFMQSLGSKTPYISDGKRKTLKDIEPTAEVSKVGYPELNGGSDPTYIQKVDWLRERIKEIYITVGDDQDYHGEVYGEQIYIKLTEARYFLGFELERLKNESEGK